MKLQWKTWKKIFSDFSFSVFGKNRLSLWFLLKIRSVLSFLENLVEWYRTFQKKILQPGLQANFLNFTAKKRRRLVFKILEARIFSICFWIKENWKSQSFSHSKIFDNLKSLKFLVPQGLKNAVFFCFGKF